MNRLEQLTNWLADRKRVYATGRELFGVLAPEAYRTRYSAYFAQIDNPSPFDPRFTKLVNLLVRIQQEISMQPDRFPAAFEEISIPQVMSDDQKSELAAQIRSRIEELEEENARLSDRMDDMDTESMSADIEQLQEQVSRNQEQIAELNRQVAQLQLPGIRVVTYDTLPVKIKKLYDRVREITPLYASIHADICREDITDDKRKELADKLCDLDDERRQCWRKIDEWSQGKTVQLDEPRPVYSDNATVRGYEIARQIIRLRQNIANSRQAADKAQADGRKNIYENALKRIERYEAELAELEREIAQEGGSENDSGHASTV